MEYWNTNLIRRERISNYVTAVKYLFKYMIYHIATHLVSDYRSKLF